MMGFVALAFDHHDLVALAALVAEQLPQRNGASDALRDRDALTRAQRLEGTSNVAVGGRHAPNLDS